MEPNMIVPNNSQAQYQQAQSSLSATPPSVVAAPPPINNNGGGSYYNQYPVANQQTNTASAPAQNNFEFLKGINLIELSLLLVGAVALYSTIYYYRFKLKEDRIATYDTNKRLDGHDSRIAGVEGEVVGIAMIMQGDGAMRANN